MVLSSPESGAHIGLWLGLSVGIQHPCNRHGRYGVQVVMVESMSLYPPLSGLSHAGAMLKAAAEMK